MKKVIGHDAIVVAVANLFANDSEDCLYNYWEEMVMVNFSLSELENNN